MARCDDCIHYDVCLKLAYSRIILCGDSADKRCKMFKSAASVAPRAEVAKEIFEEIEKCMLHDIIPTIGVYKGSLELRIAKLKKKYTEDEPPDMKGGEE